VGSSGASVAEVLLLDYVCHHLGVNPAFWAAGLSAGVESGCLGAYEDIASDYSDKGGRGMVGSY